MNTIKIILIIFIAVIILIVISVVIDLIKYEKIDGFRVLRYGPDKHASAETLGELHRRTLVLLDHLRGKYNHHPSGISDREKTLIKRFELAYDNDDFKEEDDEAFNEGKGDTIYICLYDKTEKKYIDINTLMYVVIHELAHMITSYADGDHGEEFWKNQTWLLREAQSAGIYRYVNYIAYPVKYCNGFVINRI